MASPTPGGGKPRTPRQPGGMINIPSPKPKATKNVKGTPIKTPKAKGPIVKPLPIDDKVYRTMPITEKQLGSIKKMYGIK
jgi:hypothetical protein